MKAVITYPNKELGDDSVIDKAIEKINAEMQKDPNNVYMEIIGHYIIDRCTDDVTAARVAADGKTLGGAMSAVTAAARKIAVGNVAALTPEPVFNAVDNYFGLSRSDDMRHRALMAATGGVPMKPPPPAAERVALNLDDFL